MLGATTSRLGGGQPPRAGPGWCRTHASTHSSQSVVDDRSIS